MNYSSSISNERYEEIKNAVADMYEDLGYEKIPVNVFELCHKLNIKLIRYSSLNVRCAEYSIQFSKDGFNLLNINTSQYQIYYNDFMPIERVNFTIMHEIGHIMLGHKKHTRESELEANFYARTALAPLGLIAKLKLENSNEVAATFGISSECAKNIVMNYNKMLVYPTIRNRELNSRLVRHFSNNHQEVI